MKKDIHPAYKDVTVTCGCGNSFVTRSTAPKIAVEVCANCHPFFTGKQKFLDTAGMVEKFQRRWKSDAAQKAMAAKAPPPKKGAPAAPAGRVQKTLSAQLPGGEKPSSAPAKAGAPEGKAPAVPAKAPEGKAPAAKAPDAKPEAKPAAAPPPPQKS